jgi:hypothetical protein
MLKMTTIKPLTTTTTTTLTMTIVAPSLVELFFGGTVIRAIMWNLCEYSIQLLLL